VLRIIFTRTKMKNLYGSIPNPPTPQAGKFWVFITSLSELWIMWSICPFQSSCRRLHLGALKTMIRAYISAVLYASSSSPTKSCPSLQIWCIRPAQHICIPELLNNECQL
jgi:hypothetical protein